MALLLFLCEDLFHGLVPVNAPDETCACNLRLDAGSLKCKTNLKKKRGKKEKWKRKPEITKNIKESERLKTP